MLSRRAFLASTGAVLLRRPRGAEAQSPPKVPRIGYLATGSLKSPEARVLLEAFREGLRERGYAEGRNILIEYRSAEGNVERFSALAAELVGLKVDLILAGNTPAVRATRQVTTTIPIVANAMGDPVGDGLVKSLAKPGGNITGLTFLGPELVPKRMALLKEALPRVSQVTGIWHPGAFSEETSREMLSQAEGAAKSLKLRLRLVGVRNPDELDRAFSTMAAQRTEAVFLFPSPMIFNERRRTVDLAGRYRLPVMSNNREFVELGGFMAYGASLTDLTRRAATFVDRILRGARPADLPVEQPTKFELVINLKAARTLGLTIPASLLQRADQVLQ